ncbi:MAG: hypothetical protein M9894_15525 [Planctomycetes bacterium]|nr:hypothetical protein [Planctomycetota bacterium]
MPSAYEIKLKAAALDALKASREKVRTRLGSAQIGERLQRLSADDAGKLANDLLALLDAVDAVVGRAKAVD